MTQNPDKIHINISLKAIFNFIFFAGVAMFASCNKSKRDKKGIARDIDGNTYTTITIGSKVWMKENLHVTKYRNGDPIPNIKDDKAWSELTTGAYCDYENKEDKQYGRLYNWYSVIDSRNIAPDGWHVANEADWESLLIELTGKDSILGTYLKEAGTDHWNSPNTGAKNLTGFTALPAGFRHNSGYFDFRGFYSYWWDPYIYFTVLPTVWSVTYDDKKLYRYNIELKNGYSVRCVKD